jgi:RimK family alpha-L-glutamate ligase
MSLHIIALTDYNANKGKAPPTMRKLAKMAEKKSIPFFPIQVEHAYVVDKDLMGPEITIHNYDGKGTKLDVPKSDTACIVRGGAMLNPSRRGIIKSLEESGVFMINTLECTTDTANKFTTAIKLRKAGIPTPRTALVVNDQSIPIAVEEVGGKFPIIAKTIEGSKGIGVMKIESEESLKSVLQALWKHDADLIVQEYIEIDFDVRSIVLNDKVIASVKRLNSKKEDFRTNKSLGNKTKPYKLSEKEEKMVLKAAKVSGAYFCGVDHILRNGAPEILEINSSPGTGSDFYVYDGDEGDGGDAILEDLLQTLSDKNNWDRTKVTYGVVEWVKIEGQKVKAKFDTGNWSGGIAINAQQIKKLKNKKVSFEFNGTTYTRKIINIKKVRDGAHDNGKLEERIYVEMDISVGNGVIRTAVFNLDDRSRKVYKVLVNKDFMKDNNINIDSSKKYMLGESRKTINTFKEMYK